MFLLSCLPAGRLKGSFKAVLNERVWMRGDVFVGSKVGATQRTQRGKCHCKSSIGRPGKKY